MYASSRSPVCQVLHPLQLLHLLESPFSLPSRPPARRLPHDVYTQRALWASGSSRQCRGVVARRAAGDRCVLRSAPGGHCQRWGRARCNHRGESGVHWSAVLRSRCGSASWYLPAPCPNLCGVWDLGVRDRIWDLRFTVWAWWFRTSQDRKPYSA